MKLVYLCSPYYSTNPYVMAVNVERAKILQAMVLESGKLPLYTPFILSRAGLNDKEHRDLIMELCNAYICKCDEMWVYESSNGALSAGQQKELAFVKSLDSAKPLHIVRDDSLNQWLERIVK